MTALTNIGADAASTRLANWLTIDWKACCHEVRKLQASIAKAARKDLRCRLGLRTRLSVIQAGSGESRMSGF
jgi:hypothetical protein